MKTKKINKKNIMISISLLSLFIINQFLQNYYVVFSSYVNNTAIQWDFTINNDDTSNTGSSVTLNMNLSWVSLMRFWNSISERDNATWEAYSATKSRTLSSWDGKRTVFWEFQNNSWTSIYISDDIISKENHDIPYTTWLTLWLDSMDNSTITQTNWNISERRDKSWNNYHTKQSNTGNQPNLLTDEIDFNWTSDYLYIENLNYVNTNPLDGILVCWAFRTNHVSSSYNDNWAIIDFDRSEWFTFYNKWWDYGFSYDSGLIIRDVTTTWAWINDNELHITCASYDNSIINDTVITINWNTEYIWDLEPNWSRIWVSQSTRYGFIGDGSEAETQNGLRNNLYYDGTIAELVYFDTAISSTNRKDIECYLWDKWWVSISWCPPENIKPIASIEYSQEGLTSSDVIATLNNQSESITITNNSWENTYTFTNNWSFEFQYEDNFWNTGSTIAKVDWINPPAQTVVWTWALNEAPDITSHSGASNINIDVWTWDTDVTTITATDTTYNIVWEYGTSNLSSNSWQNIMHSKMCSPIVVASHRQNVSGEIQRAPRVRNKTWTGFEIHVDNYNSTIWAVSTDIDYIIMNQWSYNFWNWFLVEAWSNNTSAVACNANPSPTPNAVNFLSNFSNPPVVIHTVSTENDSSWVVSWVNGNNWSSDSEPSTTQMATVLQRSFNSCNHSSEDIDYIAFEPWRYTLQWWDIIDTIRSNDSITSVTTTWNIINFNNSFSSAPKTVLVSQLWEDDWNGWYAQIHTWWGITTSWVYATIDRDWPGTNRNHTTEVVWTIAFSKDSWQFWEENTVSYSITGWDDSSDFTINSTSGKLDLISWKDSENYTDSNNDGIYEVIVSACDSHCDSKCSTQTVNVRIIDNINPNITSIFPWENRLIPTWNFNIEIEYNDTWVWINNNSAIIKLYKWNSSSWGNDISNSWINGSWEIITSTWAKYQTNNLTYWKYKIDFSIDDLNWNSSSTWSIFYIDEPEFLISTWSINIWTLEAGNSEFSDEITITVKTVWAPFRILLNKNQNLEISWDSINDWDWSKGFWYDKETYSNTISKINDDEIITNQTWSLNTSWEKNTYEYKIKIWALVEDLQSWWIYSWNLDFNINLEY